MRKNNSILVFLIILPLCLLDIQNLVAQSDTLLPDLIPYRKGDKWGFCNQKKEIIIQCKYDSVFLFKEGMAKVKLNGLGENFDNADVKGITSDTTEKFDQSISKYNDKYGFINKNGKEVVALNYDEANDFSEGFALVKLIYKYGLRITMDGRDKKYPIYKYGFVDKKGKEVIPLKYDYAKNFSEGLTFVILNRKWGFINNEGEEVIPLIYDVFYDTKDLKFSEGLAKVILIGKWGFVDKNG